MVLIAQIVSGLILLWGAVMALFAIRRKGSPSRLSVLGTLAVAVTILLIVRLTGPFGGWSDWFVWVWLAAAAVYVIAIARVALAWPDLPWRATDTRATGEVTAAAIGGSLLIIISAALVIPTLLLG